MKTLNLESLCDSYDNESREKRQELIKLASHLTLRDYLLFLTHCIEYHKYINEQLEKSLNLLR